jgi:hypothetical protein
MSDQPTPKAPPSKTVCTWLALLLGGWGGHRFYLHGAKDPWAWLHLGAAVVGLVGTQRMRNLGQDDVIAWLLIPFLGLSLAAAMLAALVYGLSSPERWNAKWGAEPEHPAGRTHWGTVIAAVLALLLGSGILMATIAYASQRFFEYQVLQEEAAPPN